MPSSTVREMLINPEKDRVPSLSPCTEDAKFFLVNDLIPSGRHSSSETTRTKCYQCKNNFFFYFYAHATLTESHFHQPDKHNVPTKALLLVTNFAISPHSDARGQRTKDSMWLPFLYSLMAEGGGREVVASPFHPPPPPRNPSERRHRE
ncbi:hypothetical protein CEXT_785721 [Caerostris extrusa]|uniref:Uncharacterized protein n=1 Tax=Caerostris extrusa TaxID=172846 RepID=A0AAV4SNJ7_CAEEX|nr:hypothetical protein CEXT_785721 [Caerostris extrusa]